MADTTTTTTTSTTHGPTTTTTSTTTLAPLLTVETILHKYEYFMWNEKEILSGSSSAQTVNSAFNSSFSFGMLSPSETSATLIISLRVKNATTIGKIKLGLIDDGGVIFSTSTFGITQSTQLKSTLVPLTYFAGINSTGSENNQYNISIDNRTDLTSSYVYLNLSLSENQDFNTGTVRYKWFFDYSE